MQMHLYLIYLPHVLNFPLGYFIPWIEYLVTIRLQFLKRVHKMYILCPALVKITAS
jgi:hypothetical protein